MMSESKERKVEQALDSLAENSSPDGVAKVDRQFSAKIASLADDDDAPAEMLRQLRVLWSMLKAPDDEVPWKSKALVMAALGYFVAPFDIIPDVLGKRGYADDALVVRIVYRRLGELVTGFEEPEA